MYFLRPMANQLYAPPFLTDNFLKIPTSMKPIKERFLALDVFRGMTICFMIIVNTPGSGASPYAPLEHATWFGFTPTDLVFPSFLFAVGNAMSFSQSKYKLISNAAFLKKIIKRTILIFL